jgi:signal transduction histidine kinase
MRTNTMRLGIKAQQVAGVTSIVGLALVALGAVYLSALARVLLEETRARGELLTNVIFHRAQTVVGGDDDPYAALAADDGLQSILESSLYSANVIYAAIVDADGRVVAHTDPRQTGTRLARVENFDGLLSMDRLTLLWTMYSDAGRTVEVGQPLLLEQRSFGSIRVGVSTLLIRGGLEEALGSALLTLAGTLVVAVFVAMLLAQRLLRPIHVIRSGLTRLGRGEFGVTLDLPPRDEFGDLGSSFNDISAQLSAGRPAAGAPRDETSRTAAYARKLTALGRLTAGLAHEVRNPLNAMTIHLELLRQKLAAGVEVGRRPSSTLLQDEPRADGAVAAANRPVDLAGALRHAAVIGDEIGRLDQVVQGFLKFTRPGELTLQPVALGALIAEVAELVEAEARETGVRIVRESAPDVPVIQADSSLLRQALLNLAINACQAMPVGGTLRLACGVASPDRVRVTVTDTGVGIPPDDLNRIFDLYFTTKTAGSGIGLSLVFRIVQLHDGEVEVESAPGRGTTFTLLLPSAIMDPL